MADQDDGKLPYDWQQFLDKYAYEGDTSNHPNYPTQGNQPTPPQNPQQQVRRTAVDRFGGGDQAHDYDFPNQPTYFSPNQFTQASAPSRAPVNPVSGLPQLSWPLVHDTQQYIPSQANTTSLRSFNPQRNFLPPTTVSHSNVVPPSPSTQMANQTRTFQQPGSASKRKNPESTAERKEAQRIKRRQRHHEYRTFDGQLYGAIEKPPTNGFKKVKEKCLSCVAYGRACEGNQLKGDMCQTCLENRNNCYWYDPDNGIVSFEDAQKRFGVQPYKGRKNESTSTDTIGGPMPASSGLSTSQTFPSNPAFDSRLFTQREQPIFQSISELPPIPMYTGHFLDVTPPQYGNQAQGQQMNPLAPSFEPRPNQQPLSRPEYGNQAQRQQMRPSAPLFTPNPFQELPPPPVVPIKPRTQPTSNTTSAFQQLNNLGKNHADAEYLLTFHASLMWKFAFLSRDNPYENFATLRQRLNNEYEKFYQQTAEEPAYKKLLHLLNEMERNGEPHLSYQVMYDWAGVYQRQYEPEYDFDVPEKKGGRTKKKSVRKEEEEQDD